MAWKDQDQATKDMFEYHYGAGAQAQWEKEDAAKKSKQSGQPGSKPPKGNGGSVTTQGTGRGQPANPNDALAEAWKASAGGQREAAKMQADAAIKAAELRAKVDREDIAARLRMHADSLGWEKEQFPQMLAQEARKLDLVQYELEQIGIPAQRLAQWRAEKEVELASSAYELDRERVAIQREQVMGELELGRGRLALDTELGRGNLGVQRGQLGLGVLNTAATLNNAGAAKAFQLANFGDMVRSNPDAQSWIEALYANTGPGSSLPSFGATRGEMTPASLGTIASGLGSAGQVMYDPSTGQYTQAGDSGLGTPEERAAMLKAMQPTFTRTNKLAPQALEGRTPTQLGLLQSGAEASGYSWEDALDRYRKSRIGQGMAA